MLGAIIGDIVGSPYEFDCNNIKIKDFPLFSEVSRFTDDSIMTIAVAQAVINGYGSKEKTKSEAIKSMQALGRKYPNAGYGTNFINWIYEDNPKPYNSYGNGSAMRVSAVAWIYNNLKEVEEFAEVTAAVSHDHPEGIKGAKATAAAIFLARQGANKSYIQKHITNTYHYNLDLSCEEIRRYYRHVESCQETVPEAIIAFLEGNSFEDVIRLAVSLGGDSDTLTAIAASIAEAYYHVPEEIKRKSCSILDEYLKTLLVSFDVFRSNIIERRKKIFDDLMSSKPYFDKESKTQWTEANRDGNQVRFAYTVYGKEVELLQRFAQSGDFTDFDYHDTLDNFGLSMDLDLYQRAAENSCPLLLRAMLTSIVRQERFNDGLIARAIETGTISAILDSYSKQLNSECL